MNEKILSTYSDALVARLRAADSSFDDYLSGRDELALTMESGLSQKDLVRWYVARTKARISAAVIETDPVDGRDFSKWQNLADPDQDLDLTGLELSDLAEFFDIKVGDPASSPVVDPFWTHNWNDAIQTSTAYIRGYMIFRGDRSGAEHISAIMPLLEPLLAVLPYRFILELDVETVNGTLLQRMNNFDDTVEHILAEGLLAGAYSSPGFWNGNMTSGGSTVDTISECVQNVAHWTPAAAPISPIGWNDLVFWQRGISNNSSHYWIPPTPSIVGPIDYQKCFLTDAQLAELLAVPSPPPGDHTHPELQNEINMNGEAIADIFDSIDNINIQMDSALADIQLNINEIEDLKQRVTAIENKLDAVREALM